LLPALCRPLPGCCRFRIFNGGDELHHKGLRINVYTNLLAARLSLALNDFVEASGEPISIRLDTHPVFIGSALALQA
jgi:hypothetical protein